MLAVYLHWSAIWITKPKPVKRLNSQIKTNPKNQNRELITISERCCEAKLTKKTDTLFLMAVNTTGNREEIKLTLNAYTTDILDPAKYFSDSIYRIIRHFQKKFSRRKQLDYIQISIELTKIIHVYIYLYQFQLDTQHGRR